VKRRGLRLNVFGIRSSFFPGFDMYAEEAGPWVGVMGLFSPVRSMYER
jgi:hypothetical protein